MSATRIFSCVQIKSIPCWGGKGSLHSSEAIGTPINVENFIESSLKSCAFLKQTNSSLRSASAFISALTAGNIPIPTLSIRDRNEITGLIGEIVIEEYLAIGSFGLNFYSKFRKRGTSKSRGIDLINNKGRKLILVECKHPHEPLAQISSDFEAIIGSVIDNSYIPCSQENNALRLAAIRIQFEEERQIARARGQPITTIDADIIILEDCMKKGNYEVISCILVDKKVLTSLDLSVLETKIHYDSFPPFTSLITTIVLALQDLHGLTEKMFVKNGV
jgi:hypothetical protein